MKATSKLLKYSASVLIFSVMATLAACGNNGGGGADTTVVQQNVCGVNIVCNTVPTGGTTLFQATSQDWYSVIQLSWIFSAVNPVATAATNSYQYGYGANANYGSTGSTFGNGSLYGGGSYYTGGYQNGYATTPAMYSYYGPVTASGTFSVAQSMNLGMCQLPQGSYSLTTVSQGQWTSVAMVYNLRMQATGPATIVMSLSQGQVAAKTGAQLGQLWTDANAVGRMFGNIVVETVNGYPCNMSILVQ